MIVDSEYQKPDKLIKSVVETINHIISSKKLTLNGIWSSKITQEDPFVISPLDNSNENLILINILFNSILVFSKKITEKMGLIFSAEIKLDAKKEYVQEVCLLSRSLVSKIKNFREIKNKSFKLSKESLFEIKNLKDQFNVLDIQGGSKLITDTSEFLGDFYEEVRKHLAN